jgi:hypothetical protein
VLERPPLLGWRTSDADELALRRWRGSTEIIAIETLEPDHPVFGTFRAQSGSSGAWYEVEIRSLDTLINSCDCIDHRVNGLGTCKHIEGVLVALRQRGARKFRAAAAEGSLRAEVFLDRRGEPAPAVSWRAPGGKEGDTARRFLAPFLSADGALAPRCRHHPGVILGVACGAGRCAAARPAIAPLRALARAVAAGPGPDRGACRIPR